MDLGITMKVTELILETKVYIDIIFIIKRVIPIEILKVKVTKSIFSLEFWNIMASFKLRSFELEVDEIDP